MRRELEFPPQLHASSFSSSASFAGARAYQFTLELREPGQDGKHKPAVRGGRVGPCIAKGAETRLFLPNECKRVQQVAGATGQTIKTRDQQYVALVQCIENPLKLLPVRYRAADLLLKDLLGSRLGKLLHLCPNTLAVRGYSRIAVFHDSDYAHILRTPQA